MEKSKELLENTLTELEMKAVQGGAKSSGPLRIWGAIMESTGKSCSWGGAYGKPWKSGGTCTRR